MLSMTLPNYSVWFHINLFFHILFSTIIVLHWPNTVLFIYLFFWFLLLGDGTRMADSTTMLSISDPIHMVLIKTDVFGETALVASYFLEWRSVLGSENGVASLTVELMGVGMAIAVCYLSVTIPLHAGLYTRPSGKPGFPHSSACGLERNLKE